MTCRSVSDDAQSDLKPVAELLFNTSVDDNGLYCSKLLLYGKCISQFFNSSVVTKVQQSSWVEW